MPINQESLWMIPMLNSAITVSQMHIPSKTHFQKAVGGVKNSSVVVPVEWKWYQIKLCFKQFSLHAKQISKLFQYTGKQAFSSLTMEFWHCLFSVNNVCTWPSRIRFSIVIPCRWVLERCPDESFKDCHRHTPKPVVWIYSLAITPQPNGAIFSHRKRWMVSTGLKHHKIMRKQRFQHLKALFIHFMQFCGQWITHKKWHFNTFRASFKMTKNPC